VSDLVVDKGSVTNLKI